MAFTLTAGYSWTDGEVVTATKLNSAALPTAADGQSYEFANGSVGTPSISFDSDTDLGLYRYGANQLGVAGTIFAINSTADNAFYVGQGASNNLALAWTYNATAASASATFGTFGKSNPMTIQASTLAFDSSSLAFALQIVAAGRVRAFAGTDNGSAALQSNGTVSAISSSAAAPAFTSDTDLDTGLYFPAANKVALATGGTFRAIIDSSGNVGISQPSPTSAANKVYLHVGDGDSGSINKEASLRLQSGNGAGGARSWDIAVGASTGSLEFYDSGTTLIGAFDFNGNFVLGSAAIATNATNGFIYVASCAGTPTGTPTSVSGRIPLVVDSTNHKLYFYSGGSWRDAGP